MRLTKRLMGAAAVLLVSAGTAVAATSSVSGTYSGPVKGSGDSRGPDHFTVTATLKDGKLKEIQGEGDWIPYNPKLSNATAGCGSANSFDSAGAGQTWKISGQVGDTGRFAFVAVNNFHTKVTLKGHFVSNSEAKTRFRFYQSHLPYFNKKTNKATDAGHCDSGQLRLVLTKSS